MFRNPWFRALLILVLAGALGAYQWVTNSQLPETLQKSKQCPPAEASDNVVTRWFKDRCLNLGLDLAGGTQLRYRIDLSQVELAQRDAVVDGIRGLMDKRVNSLGVSEPIVTPSTLNGQSYITVELPGTKDIDTAIAQVGKTVLLEFKEQKTSLTEEEKKADADYNASKKALAEKTRERAKTEDFHSLANELSEANFDAKGGIFENKFKEDIVTPELQELLFTTLKPGDVSDVLEYKPTRAVSETVTEQQLAGYSIVKLLKREDISKDVKEPAKATVTHLLVSYAGASSADPKIIRTKEEAKKLADELLAKAKDPKEDFLKLIADNSDDPSKVENKGTFKDQPIGDADATKNAFVKEFNDAIVSGKVGEIVGPVDTAFGYHIIRIDAKSDMIDSRELRPQVSYEEIFFTARAPSDWRDTGLTGKQFKLAIAQPVTNSLQGYEVSILFNDEGAKLFGEITKRNIEKPVAIFLDGQIVSAPTVQSEITDGKAVITGNFNAKDATELAKNLNTGALPAPITLVDQRQVEASLGGVALEKSLQAGLIGMVILALFMLLFYRLPGLISIVALALYALLLVALFRIWPGFTLSLAGIAGNILAIGMAVDANILIFERMREELHGGKSLELAVDHGFRRAWTSIRDSNASSIITALVLTVIGTSVVRGFALTLILGILTSLFTAIWVTRSLLIILMQTPLARVHWLWVPGKQTIGTWSFMNARKWAYGFSVLLLVSASAILLGFGAKLGLDFTGGSLVELKFTSAVPTADQIKGALTELEKPIVAPGFVKTDATATEKKYDFSNVQVVATEATNSIILKLPLIDQATYERLVEKMGAFNAEQPVQKVRFETIGPTVGEGLRQNTWKALLYAIILMIAYIAFAFRKVPKVASPWKFGVTAVVALLHDIFITVGFFALMGHFYGWEFDTLFVTAMLTVFGFSVHDTIVVFDRIRENLILHGRQETLQKIANDAIHQTIARSINTSLTTVITLSALALLGADTIRPFAVALVFGIAIGTYSSIFVATPLLVDWSREKKRSA